MKVMTILFTLMTSCLAAQSINEPALYKETNHLKLFCNPIDQAVADDMASVLEALFDKASQEFDHAYSAKISFYIYPDLSSFHQAINWPTAPDWIVGDIGVHKRITVSPRNPGVRHSYDSVMRSNKSSLIALFITDKYKKPIPRWLKLGVGLYRADFFSNEQIEKLTKDLSLLPTIEQLEAVKDTAAFYGLDGFLVSASLVQFIDQRWGWETIMKLLDDYSEFERTLLINKQDFRREWQTFLANKYKSLEIQ